ncbi:hypothetical protein D3C77_681320 [compost metagenome]
MPVGDLVQQVQAVQLPPQTQQAILPQLNGYPLDAPVGQDAHFQLVEHQQQAVLAATRCIGLAEQHLA